MARNGQTGRGKSREGETQLRGSRVLAGRGMLSCPSPRDYLIRKERCDALKEKTGKEARNHYIRVLRGPTPIGSFYFPGKVQNNIICRSYRQDRQRLSTKAVRGEWRSQPGRMGASLGLSRLWLSPAQGGGPGTLPLNTSWRAGTESDSVRVVLMAQAGREASGPG